jgi:hypothetical protein
LYKTHIKDKPIISTQKNTTNEELEINENLNNDEELNENDLNNCFTLTQSKNEDGLTFTECANETRVYKFVYFINNIYLFYNSMENAKCINY